jgi:hypothetical protein
MRESGSACGQENHEGGELTLRQHAVSVQLRKTACSEFGSVIR